MSKISLNLSEEVMEEISKHGNKSYAVNQFLKEHFRHLDSCEDITKHAEFNEAVDNKVIERGNFVRKSIIENIVSCPTFMAAILSYEADTGQIWNPYSSGGLLSILKYAEHLINEKYISIEQAME